MKEAKEKNGNVSKKNLSALEDYINKVYVLVCLLVPGACLIAGVAYTMSGILGLLPSVSMGLLLVFDLTCIIYFVIGVYFVRTGFRDGLVLPSKLKAGKIYIVLIMFIQYNFIFYMIPARDFWGFALFFVLLASFFLDYKMVTITSIEIFVSLIVGWMINGNNSLPPKDEHFLVNMLDRITGIALSLSSLILLTYLVGRFLVNAKKDEMERNNERVLKMLSSVQSLSQNLHVAGSNLSQISENESASAEELAATSEMLLTNSNLLGDKTEKSMSNLKELNKWEAVVADNVEKVEQTSKNLLDKSKDNEELLNELQSINSEVSDSMLTTIDVAQKLSEAVKEIGVTLQLINEISSSTNLLALNASIEAARAGESGRGFAVVAQEVGNLANSTKQSLDEVEAVIARVQGNVNEITLHVEENSQKLTKQNEYFNNVFNGIKDMTQLLHVSVGAVNTMGDAHHKQATVIKDTVMINQDIAENIYNENQQFKSINAMVESNVNDIVGMSEQVNSINGMVEEINILLANQ